MKQSVVTLLTLTTATSTFTVFDSMTVSKTVEADILLFRRVESFLHVESFKRFAFSNAVLFTAVLASLRLIASGPSRRRAGCRRRFFVRSRSGSRCGGR